MLLPFLPLLLALTGISLLGLMPAGASAPPQGVELAVGYLALLLPGLVLGNLHQPWLGARSPMRLSTRRMLLFALWMAQAGSMSIAQGGVVALEGLGFAQEAAIGLMLVNFWLSDSLALQPFNPLRWSALAAQTRQLGRNLAISLPIMLLVLAGLVISPVAALISNEGGAGGSGGLLPPWLEPLGTLAIYLAVAGLVIPVLIPFCWRLRELEAPQARGIIQEELAANGVSVARVLNWPAEMTGHATAGVIGLVPRFRYLLFSDMLAGALTPDEIRAVTAHEATHLRQRHLWYFVAAILAFVLGVHVVLQVLVLAGLWLHYTLPFWAMAVIEVGGLLLFLRFGVGFLSRNFERQADGGALRRIGLDAFRGAMLKVAGLNRIPPEADNWHHYGIGRRLAYLEIAQQAPETLASHDHRVGRIKAACIALLAAGLMAQAVFSSPVVVAYLIENFWIRGLENAAAPSATTVNGLRYLAMQAYARDDLEAAERYFRRLLEITPEDPEIQNNLAWLLVTRPGADAGQVEEGLRLSRLAAQASDSAFIWDTVAEAYLRGGHRSQAQSAAARALRQAEQGQGRGKSPLSYYRNRLTAIGRAEAEKGKNNP